MDKELEIITKYMEKIEEYEKKTGKQYPAIYISKELCIAIKEKLQRLDKYEQILGSGRLTNRNYKNTTLPLESCKPFLRLGQLEDIYEKGK